MSSWRRWIPALAGLATVVACAGCGSATRPDGPAAAPGAPKVAAPLLLTTAAATSRQTWAVVPMGAAAGPNEFWQLFSRAAGATRWSLATPPDLATNGAIALAGLDGRSLVTSVRPSLHLDFSPLDHTADGGRRWTAGPPAPGLASVPDALAATPDGSRLLDLNRAGQVQDGSSGGSNWTALTSERALAATAAGRSCGLTRLTAVDWSAAVAPLVAGDCSRAGVVGFFAREDGSWRLAGPVLPAAVAGQRVAVLRLASVGNRLVVVVQTGGGASGRLLAAWSGGTGRWVWSAPLPLGGAGVREVSTGSGGAIAATLTTGTGVTLTGPGGAWRHTPALPAGVTVDLAQPSPGETDALCADGSTLTVWRLNSSGTQWARTQTIHVPIQYGSSS